MDPVALVLILGAAYLLFQNGALAGFKGIPGTAGNPTAKQHTAALEDYKNGNWGPVADPAVYAAMIANERAYTAPDNGPQESGS